MEIALEVFRRRRRPFGSGVEEDSLLTDFQCVDFKRLKGVPYLDFFCEICAEVKSSFINHVILS